ncbi:MAG: hypothetical protein CM15mP111_4500 [Hyphomicrobiales bacterium]|nr:MAG: hypothetical protein CM15mP111_4500 [Hyphomicrobiales bacterium]
MVKDKSDIISTNNSDIINDENIHALIVSTSEPEHYKPVISALEEVSLYLLRNRLRCDVDEAEKWLKLLQK